MKFVKMVNGEEASIELHDPNTFNVATRAGFEPVEEDDAELTELRAKAKELGIRNAHSMGKEKLLEKIAEKGA